MSIVLSNIELKVCPFCGEKPIFTKDSHPNGLWYYKIFCDNCNFHIGTVKGENSIINKWNTRNEVREE